MLRTWQGPQEHVLPEGSGSASRSHVHQTSHYPREQGPTREEKENGSPGRRQTVSTKTPDSLVNRPVPKTDIQEQKLREEGGGIF